VVGAEIKRPPVYRITVVQLIALTVLYALVFTVNKVFASSVLWGGLIAILPQAYFAAQVFRRSGARSAQAVAHASYKGVVGKFVFSAAGFAVVFATFRPIDGLGVFAGYIVLLVVQFIGSWLLLKNS
jgi:ATP synthase protein I